MDKGVTKFSTWEMTCVLITSFIARLGSFREIEETLNIPRSTFGDALKNRCSGFFQELVGHVINQIRVEDLSRKKKKAIREILAMDSSEIRVHGSLFSLLGWKLKKCLGNKAAAKLHVIWNVHGEWVENFLVTPGRRGDSPVSRLFKLLSDKTYVFDRAYNDLSFWYDIMSSGSHFVTRLKNIPKNKLKLILSKIKKSDRCKILFDGIYTPTPSTLSRHSNVPKDIKFRHIIYRDPESGKVFHFVTSDFKSSPTVIADIYKKRWAVELLFKWLKGHLNVRYLPVKSPNAVRIQLTISILVLLLLQLKMTKERLNKTLWELLRTFRATVTREGLYLSLAPDGCRWKLVPAKDLSS